MFIEIKKYSGWYMIFYVVFTSQENNTAHVKRCIDRIGIIGGGNAKDRNKEL